MPRLPPSAGGIGALPAEQRRLDVSRLTTPMIQERAGPPPAPAARPTRGHSALSVAPGVEPVAKRYTIQRTEHALLRSALGVPPASPRLSNPAVGGSRARAGSTEAVTSDELLLLANSSDVRGHPMCAPNGFRHREQYWPPCTSRRISECRAH